MLATSPSDRLVPEGTGCSKPFVCHQDDTVLLNHNVIYNNASNVNSHTSNDNINMFYVVSFENSDEFFSSSPKNERCVFKQKDRALAFMKKVTYPRLRVFNSQSKLNTFLAQPVTQGDDKQSECTKNMCEDQKDKLKQDISADFEKFMFKGPKLQDLNQFRKLVEGGDSHAVKSQVWSNPRFLVSAVDTPTILHEGMRHNAIHIAARFNHASIVSLVLDAITDQKFIKLLYLGTRDTADARDQRMAYLLDLYLNSHDKGCGECPLHIACKMGAVDVVHALVMFSVTNRSSVNKFGERPDDIICSRCKGARDTIIIKERIHELLQGLCIVPLLRSIDNITTPIIGVPCSPDDRIGTKPDSLRSTGTTPTDPLLTPMAYAGPMSPSKAVCFHKQWIKPRSLLISSSDSEGLHLARRQDAEKGYERIGRKLAQQLHVPWTEYWQFLDAFVDLTSLEGLQRLEQYLYKQCVVHTVEDLFSSSSYEEEDFTSGSDDNSDEELFYSCEEDDFDCGSGVDHSGEQDVDHSGEQDVDQRVVFSGGDGGNNDDVFEESYEWLCVEGNDYMTGRGVQLPRKIDCGCGHNGCECYSEDTGTMHNDVSHTALWTYREQVGSLERDNCLPEDSVSSEDISDESGEMELIGDEKRMGKHEGAAKCLPSSNGVFEKSFDTVITELSKQFDEKLIFSPHGPFVTLRSKCQAPDIGFCISSISLPDDVFQRTDLCSWEVVLHSSSKGCTFLSDILLRVDVKNRLSNDRSADNLSSPATDCSGEHLLRDVLVVTRSLPAYRHMRRLSRQLTATVALLEPPADDVSDGGLCVEARFVRRRKRNLLNSVVYIHGREPTKTDLDVMRAMTACQVDADQFPIVHRWLSSITAKDDKTCWPSPVHIRHRRRLSELHPAHQPTTVSQSADASAASSTPQSHRIQLF